MIVLLDIGNTRTKYCTIVNDIRSKHAVITNTAISPEFLTRHFKGAFRFIVASVSDKTITNEMKIWCDLSSVKFEQIISERKKSNVTSGYKIPTQLGVDRWLTLLGAARLYVNKNVLIIDAGTATTVDLLAATGQHQGGWILAGLTTLIKSVLADTSHVYANKKEQASIVFGVNTSENVHNAAWAATVGAIQIAIIQAEEQGFFLDEVIITGGNGKLLASIIKHKSKVFEDLVFIGMEAYL